MTTHTDQIVADAVQRLGSANTKEQATAIVLEAVQGAILGAAHIADVAVSAILEQQDSSIGDEICERFGLFKQERGAFEKGLAEFKK